MKSSLSSIIPLSLALAALTHGLRADIVIPGADGSDGALNISANTTIDLSRAIGGVWSDSLDSANAGKGIYDRSKWAVVFKYTEVNIAKGAKVTFKNHPSRAPVVWLVSGNASISGEVILDGQVGQAPPLLAEPGPGGFRGGAGDYLGVMPGSGFGPGGGAAGSKATEYASAGYGLPGSSSQLPQGSAYGNPSIIPLVGGSGGGGSPLEWRVNSGGAGGGAILMAVAKELIINGSISAVGGNPFSPDPVGSGGGGSGGAIRLIAENLGGAGLILATGSQKNSGGMGRVRIERSSTGAGLIVTPDPSVVDIATGTSAVIWPPSGSPEVRIVSIGSVEAPADPRAGFGTLGADVSIPITSNTAVIVETRNVEQASQVLVRGTPRMAGSFAEANATLANVVSTDPLVIRWTAALPVKAGYSAVQVRVIRP